MSASKCKLQASTTTNEQVDGVNSHDNQQWTFMHMSKLNGVIKYMFYPECSCQGVTVKTTNKMGFSSKLTLQCSNPACTYTSNMHMFPRAEGGKHAYTINTVMTLLAHELGVAHTGLNKMVRVLGICVIYVFRSFTYMLMSVGFSHAIL